MTSTIATASAIEAPATAGDITFTAEEELSAYRDMVLIRRFEEKVGQLVALGAIQRSCRLSVGQEASIVGLTMAAGPADQLIATERGHGQMLALGVEPERIMTELLDHDRGLCGGKAGPGLMHSREHRFMGAFRGSAAAALLGAGVALASKYRDDRAVCLCFIGEGETQHDCVNDCLSDAYAIAVAGRLPVVFIVDSSAPGAAHGALPSANVARARSSGVPAEQVDGRDVRKARAAGLRALEHARGGAGPFILEMLTEPYRGHDVPAEEKTRAREKSREEIDPIARSRHRILRDRVATETELKAIENDMRDIVSDAAEAARATAWSGPLDLTTHGSS